MRETDCHERVSSGARASELPGACYGDADPGQQLVSVVRKGSRAIQEVPASPDAFVWLWLYQAQMHGLVAIVLRRPAIVCDAAACAPRRRT